MQSIILWLSGHTLVSFAILIYIALFFWLMRFQKKLGITWKEAMLVSLMHVVIGWSCMELLALIEAGFDFEKAANIRLYGAIFALPFVYYAWARITARDPKMVLDIAAICVIFGAISGRMNCFTNGCCEGYPIPFLLAYRWPLREMEMIYYFLFIFCYAGKIQKGKTWGQVYPAYLIGYGTLRFLSEFVREEYTGSLGSLHLAHIWSLIAIAVGTGLYIKIAKEHRSGEVRRKKPGKHPVKKEGGKAI